MQCSILEIGQSPNCKNEQVRLLKYTLKSCSCKSYMGKIWILPPIDNFLTKKSGQGLPYVHVLLLKKSNLKGIFIRTNDPQLAICFPPSCSQFLPSFLPPSLPHSLPSFLSSFYYSGFCFITHHGNHPSFCCSNVYMFE